MARGRCLSPKLKEGRYEREMLLLIGLEVIGDF
jgi:hypothetical protein